MIKEKSWYRRHAIQLIAQLPEEKDDALEVCVLPFGLSNCRASGKRRKMVKSQGRRWSISRANKIPSFR